MNVSLLCLFLYIPGGTVVKIHLPVQEIQELEVRSLGQEDPLKKKIATHSSILTWEIPWTVEPGKESDTTEVT